ncbi:uncharacterized protein LOC143852635 isoform X4 [Tasmannia lanceolata]|uniref:uncharacterized protein LOC143852635 isoform X4 n=1 Tax=Tasmannia lanceolata TaxID=3420 RepID=UPI0040637A3F
MRYYPILLQMHVPPATDIFYNIYLILFPTYYRYLLLPLEKKILISTEKMLSLTKIDLKVYKGNPHLLHVLSQTIVQVLDRFGSNIIFLNRMKDLWSTGRPLGTSLMTLDRKRAVWAIYGSFSVFDKYFT